MKNTLPICALILLGGCTSVMGPDAGLEQSQVAAMQSASVAMVNPVSAPATLDPEPPSAAPVPEFRDDSRAPAPSVPVVPSTGQVVDASAKTIPGDLLGDAIAAFADFTDDTQSVQLRRLRVFKMADNSYDSLCGEFNAKAADGTYAGFRSFQYLPPFRQISLSAVSCRDLRSKPLPEHRDISGLTSAKPQGS